MMLREVALSSFAAPAPPQGLDFVGESRCLEGRRCEAAKVGPIKLRPAGEEYAFILVDGPELTAVHDTSVSVTRFTTDPVFDLFWSMVTGRGGATATAPGATSDLTIATSSDGGSRHEPLIHSSCLVIGDA